MSTLVPLQVAFYAEQVLNGLALGTILILMSIGLTIVFGLLGIINFAHGEFLLVGMYTAWVVTLESGSYLLGLVAAAIAVAILGLIVERGILRPLYDRDVLLQVLITFGLAELLRGTVMYIWGTAGKTFDVPSWGVGRLDLGLFAYPKFRLALIGIGLTLAILSFLFLHRTNYGLLIRAGTQDRGMTEMLGLNISRIFMIAFVLGSAIAGIAGGLIAPIRGVYPAAGQELLIISFVVVIVGGMGSFVGTAVAGLLIGQLIAWTQTFYPAFSSIVVFVFMVGVIIIRPHGIFGSEGVFE